MALKETGIIQHIKAELTSTFSMVDMGPISFYLGLKIEQNRTNQTIKFFQPNYIDKMLVRFNPNKANVVSPSIKETSLL